MDQFVLGKRQVNCEIIEADSYSLSFVVYVLRMLFFGLALLIAAQPDLDNPGCYRDGWDYFRGVCEGISLLFFLFKIVDKLQEIFRWLHSAAIARNTMVWHVIHFGFSFAITVDAVSQRSISRTTTTACSYLQ